jgi:hypothetical protein
MSQFTVYRNENPETSSGVRFLLDVQSPADAGYPVK